MRIIGGRLKRRALKTPTKASTRPTTDRVRESLFNVLEARRSLAGVRVLDLFAGTGALALEAISRGAASALFVEQDAAALRLARANAKALGVEQTCSFVRGDAVAFLQRPPRLTYDLVFADPPYDLDALATLPALAQAHLAEEGLLALEHDVRHSFDESPGWLLSRPYGRTIVSLFARPAVESPPSEKGD